MQKWVDQGRDLPDGFDSATYDISPVPNVGTVKPGDELSVGEKYLELIPIPGHTPGLLGVLDREANIIHISDILESEDEGKFELLAHFVLSDFEAYQDTIDRLISYRDEGAFEMMTQTHGAPIQDLSVLDDAKYALEAVANGEVSYETKEHPLGTQRKYEIDNIIVSVRDK
jgi:glyoxylase-like metal-dependent hydrolase (beta-lactamase superfamily II)